MNTAYILIGGNMGDRLQYLQGAKTHIETECGSILIQSSIYETAAWGNEDQPPFLNQVIVVHTILAPLDLLDSLLQIENKMGRIRDKRNDPRTIDLDILLYNLSAIVKDNLYIPHPRLHLRKFVLVPMVEIAPQLRHPILRRTMERLLKLCVDKLMVTKYSPDNQHPI